MVSSPAECPEATGDTTSKITNSEVGKEAMASTPANGCWDPKDTLDKYEGSQSLESHSSSSDEPVSINRKRKRRIKIPIPQPNISFPLEADDKSTNDAVSQDKNNKAILDDARNETAREASFHEERFKAQRELVPSNFYWADKISNGVKLQKKNIFTPTKDQLICPKPSDNPISIRYMVKEVKMPPSDVAHSLIALHEEHRFHLDYPALVDSRPVKYKWYAELHPSSWRKDPEKHEYRWTCEPITPVDNIPKTIFLEHTNPRVRMVGGLVSALREKEIAKYERIKRFWIFEGDGYMPCFDDKHFFAASKYKELLKSRHVESWLRQLIGNEDMDKIMGIVKQIDDENLEENSVKKFKKSTEAGGTGDASSQQDVDKAVAITEVAAETNSEADKSQEMDED